MQVSIKMTGNNEIISWFKSVLENLLVFTAPIFYMIFAVRKAYDKRVDAQTKRDREFVTEVAKEVSRTVVKEILDSVLPDIHSNIQDIKKETHNINKRIDDLLNR